MGSVCTGVVVFHRSMVNWRRGWRSVINSRRGWGDLCHDYLCILLYTESYVV